MVDVAQEVQTPSGSISINGSYDPRFEGVFKEFEQNFAERGEVGDEFVRALPPRAADHAAQKLGGQLREDVPAADLAPFEPHDELVHLLLDLGASLQPTFELGIGHGGTSQDRVSWG